MYTLVAVVIAAMVSVTISSPVVPQQEKLTYKDVTYDNQDSSEISKFARETEALKRKARCFWLFGNYDYYGPPGPGPMGMGPMDMGPIGPMDMGPIGPMDMGPIGPMDIGPVGPPPYIFGGPGYYRKEDSAVKEPVYD